jgi:hypothetical protein
MYWRGHPVRKGAKQDMAKAVKPNLSDMSILETRTILILNYSHTPRNHPKS